VVEGNIALRIKELRYRTGMNQKGFAVEMGMSPASVSNWETGRTKPQLSSLYRIARAYSMFGVTYYWLLKGVKEPEDWNA